MPGKEIQARRRSENKEPEARPTSRSHQLEGAVERVRPKMMQTVARHHGGPAARPGIGHRPEVMSRVMLPRWWADDFFDRATSWR